MILITGATGFLGRHLSMKLMQRGERIIGLGRKARNLEFTEANITVFSSYDVNLPELFKKYNFTKVIHCATDYGRGKHKQSDLEMANYILPKALYDISNEIGCELFINCESFLQKGNDRGRNSEYISTKNKLRDHILTNPGVTRHISLQLEHMYGPQDNPNKLIPSIINSALNGSNYIKLGSCNVLRDLIHVNDVVSAFEVVLYKHKEIEEDLLEVGSGVSVDLKKAVCLLVRIINDKNFLNEKRLNVVFSSEERDQLYQSKADIKGLQKYGWNPKILLSSGFEDLIDCALSDIPRSL